MLSEQVRCKQQGVGLPWSHIENMRSWNHLLEDCALYYVSFKDLANQEQMQ